MIRTKAKGLLLSFMLVVASIMFFSCKQQAKINVESVSFIDTSISLLVGEEYSPQVKVLPSYATIRSYALISGDVTALKIEGGTITALKPAMGVTLKVVSDDNENANDVIVVNIYNEASELQKPTGLNFDGTKITFVGKDNASSYVLDINGNEINIGNNTEYNFELVEQRFPELKNQIINCKVKSVGDGKIFIDSDYEQMLPFVKLSGVDNAYVQSSNLHFDEIAGVTTYNIEVVVQGETKQTIIATSDDIVNGQAVVDISALIDSKNGAKYVLNVVPNAEGFEGVDKDYVFVGQTTKLNYNVLGMVNNVTVANKVVSWNFVENAQTYTVQVFKGNDLIGEFDNITTNYLQLSYIDAGEYYCQVLANSSNENTTTGKIYSQLASFKILQAPTIIANNNSVYWESVEDAQGYLVTIRNGEGEIVPNINKKFVISNSYNVSSFGAGTYSIEAIACGNSKDIITSAVSPQTSWIVLKSVQASVVNKTLKWIDNDVNTKQAYVLNISGQEIVLPPEKSTTGEHTYDLSGYEFEPKTHNITVKSVGEGYIFDSAISSTSLIKLATGSFKSLTNKQFIINPVSDAVEYKVEVYKKDDLTTSIKNVITKLANDKFDLDAESLSAGNYVAKVFVYGNNDNIFDADNYLEGNTIEFEKLETPTITIDYENLQLVIDKDGQIANKKSYKLFDNGVQQDINGNKFDLSKLGVGEYWYTAQSKGDNSTILDSNITLERDIVKVKKLNVPAISFNKENLTFKVESDDAGLINTTKPYIFKFDQTELEVNNGIANARSEIETRDVGTYTATVYANPQSSTSGYNGYELVLASGEASCTVTKLDGLCNFEIVGGDLVVTPIQQLSGTGYNLTLRIDTDGADIVLNNFEQRGSYFQTNLYDANYKVRTELKNLVRTAGEYEIYTTISKDDANAITSVETKSVNTQTDEPYKLKVLGKVGTIGKNNQNIEFSVVEDATNYKARISVEGRDVDIDIAGQYTTETNNILAMDKLLPLMMNAGIEYKEGIDYAIRFISLTTDKQTISNEGVFTYHFAFLKAPELLVTETIVDGDNVKSLNIINNDINSIKYNMIISQGADLVNEEVSKQSGDLTLINMDAKTEIKAGDMTIFVNALASDTSNYYFNSQNSQININKLDSSIITIENGLLTWNKVNNAQQYNLFYSNAEISLNVVNLFEGVENFSIVGNKCIYDFTAINPGNTNYYLQVDSILEDGSKYYLNSNDGTLVENIYKLSPLEISIKSGEVYTEVRSDEIANISKIEVKIDEVWI